MLACDCALVIKHPVHSPNHPLIGHLAFPPRHFFLVSRLAPLLELGYTCFIQSFIAPCNYFVSYTAPAPCNYFVSYTAPLVSVTSLPAPCVSILCDRPPSPGSVSPVPDQHPSHSGFSRCFFFPSSVPVRPRKCVPHPSI